MGAHLTAPLLERQSLFVQIHAIAWKAGSREKASAAQ